MSEPFGLLVAFSAVLGLLVSSLLMVIVRVLVGVAGWFGLEVGGFLASAFIIIPVGCNYQLYNICDYPVDFSFRLHPPFG